MSKELKLLEKELERQRRKLRAWIRTLEMQDRVIISEMLTTDRREELLNIFNENPAVCNVIIGAASLSYHQALFDVL